MNTPMPRKTVTRSVSFSSPLPAVPDCGSSPPLTRSRPLTPSASPRPPSQPSGLSQPADHRSFPQPAPTSQPAVSRRLSASSRAEARQPPLADQPGMRQFVGDEPRERIGPGGHAAVQFDHCPAEHPAVLTDLVPPALGLLRGLHQQHSDTGDVRAHHRADPPHTALGLLLRAGETRGDEPRKCERDSASRARTPRRTTAATARSRSAASPIRDTRPGTRSAATVSALSC